uniref:Prostate stem cell antigen n=1 Tax=Papio anubis TaxID=9555 RepID=A0A096NQH9_PAPAN
MGQPLRPLPLHPTGTALLCYSCKAQVSNEDCLNVENCRAAEEAWDRSGAVGLLTVISKGCSSNCVDDSQDYYVGKKNITCCDTDLCNASGAHALQPAAAILALLPALSLLLWGPRQL